MSPRGLVLLFTVLFAILIAFWFIGKAIFNCISAAERRHHSVTNRISLTVIIMLSPWITMMSVLFIIRIAEMLK